MINYFKYNPLWEAEYGFEGTKPLSSNCAYAGERGRWELGFCFVLRIYTIVSIPAVPNRLRCVVR